MVSPLLISKLFRGKGRKIDYALYHDDWKKVEELATRLNTTEEEYLDGVFYPVWGEGIYKRVYHPRLLHSKWGVDKYENYALLKKKEMLSPLTMEKAYITKTVKEIKSPKFFVGDAYALYPPCVDKIKDGTIAMSYAVMQPEFWAMYKTLDKDIKETFFKGERLVPLKRAIQRNPELIKFIWKLRKGE